MIRLKLSTDLRYKIANQASNFIFNIHPAQTGHHKLLTDSLGVLRSVIPIVPSHTTFGTPASCGLRPIRGRCSFDTLRPSIRPLHRVARAQARTGAVTLNPAFWVSRQYATARVGYKLLALKTVPNQEALPTEQRCANAQDFSLHANGLVTPTW